MRKSKRLILLGLFLFVAQAWLMGLGGGLQSGGGTGLTDPQAAPADGSQSFSGNIDAVNITAVTVVSDDGDGEGVALTTQESGSNTYGRINFYSDLAGVSKTQYLRLNPSTLRLETYDLASSYFHASIALTTPLVSHSGNGDLELNIKDGYALSITGDSGEVASISATGVVTCATARYDGQTITASTDTLTVTDGKYVYLDGTSNTVNVTLPAATAGVEFTIKAVDITNSCWITSSDNIDGSGNYTFSAQYESVDVRSDGSTWWIH